MKKLFVSFVTMIAAVVQLMAEVTDLSQLSNEKVYTISSARAFLLYSSAVPGKICSSTGKSVGEVTFNNTDPNQQFYIEKRENNYYLYSIGAAKYVNQDGSYVDSPSASLTLNKVGGDYPWKLCIGGNGMNSQDPNQVETGILVNSWTTTDAGNCYMIEEVKEKIYSISIQNGKEQTIKIGNETYRDGDTYTVLGSVSRNDITVVAPDGEFAIVSVDDVECSITVHFSILPMQPAVVPYSVPNVYPMQQEAVGIAKCVEENGIYTLSNNVLAASFIHLGNAVYFAGSRAMNLEAGTELFTVAFGNGDVIPASAMTLKNIKIENLEADNNAIGGAEHFAGKQIVANYEYTYKACMVNIIWRAVLRDGSHYLRTEMELEGVDDVDMFNVIPMIYNVNAKNAGSTPKVIGNTRGAVIMSDKIFAGLETPTAYNTVGGATGEEEKWTLTRTYDAVQLTAESWEKVSEEETKDLNRVTEATGASYPNIYAYKQTGIELKKNQKVEIKVEYTSGSHKLNFGGADLLAMDGSIPASDYHSGYSGNSHENNIFTITVPYDGTYTIRVFAQDKTESIDASSKLITKVYTAKDGVAVNSDIIGIQGRWSRNTTLLRGETWKVGAVVGLIAQDGTEADTDIHKTQKRRSFLAYSERERAVPWRAVPVYVAWYELQINHNNAAPGREHLDNTKEADVLDVMAHWKSDLYDRYGIAPSIFVIDDGWDKYGEWTFHEAFPDELKNMSAKAKEMGSNIGAWLGPVGGYGASGNYRRDYWKDKGGMQLSNPRYYEAFKDAAYNLVKEQGDNYTFFKFDGISGQFSATGPDNGDTGNENAEGIIRLERYVREELREDIFFNTTVGTWASPFWYQISDATWRQEKDYGEEGNNSIDREKWITYRDRLVHQNYVQNSPICPINTLMTHGFILTGNPKNSGDYSCGGWNASRNITYKHVLNELRCAFLCGSGLVELYNDYDLMNSINGGALWADVAECIAWQKRNADVLPDAHWVGGNPWTGSVAQVYGWAAWNGNKATLALRNGANGSQTYTFTLREALNIPANLKGKVTLNPSFKVQGMLEGLTLGIATDIDEELTVKLPGSSVFGFDGVCEFIHTSVEQLQQEVLPQSFTIYDLQGRRLNTIPDKGLYIQNNKKILKR